MSEAVLPPDDSQPLMATRWPLMRRCFQYRALLGFFAITAIAVAITKVFTQNTGYLASRDSEFFIVGIWSGLIGCVGVWLALGRPRLIVRLLAAGLIVAIVVGSMARSYTRVADMFLVCAVACLVVVVTTFGFVSCSLFFFAIDHAQPKRRASWAPRFQLRLTDLFVISTLVAIGAALCHSQLFATAKSLPLNFNTVAMMLVYVYADTIPITISAATSLLASKTRYGDWASWASRLH